MLKGVHQVCKATKNLVNKVNFRLSTESTPNLNKMKEYAKEASLFYFLDDSEISGGRHDNHFEIDLSDLWSSKKVKINYIFLSFGNANVICITKLTEQYKFINHRPDKPEIY